MNRRRQIITLGIVLFILIGLVYLQVREWRHFDWEKFKEGTEGLNWWYIAWGVIFIHVADFLRALRWKVFLRPTRPQTPWTSLVAPQFVGFAGLAILGRPGELIRPYLLAKRANTTVSAQIAIWFIERAFDIGSVAIILAVNLFAIPQIRADYRELWKFGIALIALFLGLVCVLYVLWRRGPEMSEWVCKKLDRFSHSFASSLEHKLRTASSGLHVIKDLTSFLLASGISLSIWLLVALAYRQVLHAFPPSAGELSTYGIPEAVLLMSASVAGGVIQLPVVGGGAQLATIALLVNSFDHYNEHPEIAVAAGLMFWLVTFISVAPLGLLLAHFEHVSIRKISKESEVQAEKDS